MTNADGSAAGRADAQPAEAFGDLSDYAQALGARLREIRSTQHLSLHEVERRSGGRWKAVVVGSYERGDRSVSVQRLAELAAFYGVPATDLLPRETHAPPPGAPAPLQRVVISVARLYALDDPAAAGVVRFVRTVLHARNATAAPTITIRNSDLAMLAMLYEISVAELTERLVRWQVLAPDSVILDGRP